MEFRALLWERLPAEELKKVAASLKAKHAAHRNKLTSLTRADQRRFELAAE